MNVLNQPRRTIGSLFVVMFIALLLIWIANGIWGISGVPGWVAFMLGGTVRACLLGIGVVAVSVLVRILRARWRHPSARWP